MKYYKTIKNGTIISVGMTNDSAILPKESKQISLSEYKSLYTIFTINPYPLKEDEENVSIQNRMQ